MSRNNIIRTEALVAGGGTITIESESGVTLLRLTGTSITLVGSYNIVTSGTFSDGDLITTFYNGTLDFDGNTFTIFGKAVPEYLESSNFIAYSYFNGSSFDTYIVVDPSLSGVVDGDSIVTNTINGASILAATILQAKMENLDEGSVLIGNVSGVPTPLDAKLTGRILIGNATTLRSLLMSGDLTMDLDGVTTIGNNVITPEMLSFGIGGELRAIEVTLTDTQIKALFTSPITILTNGSVGTGKIAEVLRVVLVYNFDTAAYVYSGDLRVQYNSGATILDVAQADVQATADKNWVVPSVQYDLFAGSGIQVQALVADPTGGNANSTLKVRIFYTITDE